MLLVVGCGSTKRSYQVDATNQTDGPVTLWLLKSGGPAEDGWRAPEDLIADPERARYDLAIVPPGRMASTPRMSGEFPPGAEAVLRVYEGEKELFHILQEMKAGQARATEYVLRPGRNQLTITRRGDDLHVAPTRE